MTFPSAKKRYFAEPQRRNRGAWQSCAAHEAQRWAVILLNKGRPKVISSFSTKGEAQAAADTMNGTLRRRSPATPAEAGERYGPLGVRGKGRIVARSLTEEEYRR